MIILRGVNVFPTQIEELLLEIDALSPHFQCILTRPGRMDVLTVAVETRPGVDQQTAAEAGRRLAAAVKHRIGVTIEVDVRPERGVTRSLGKAVRLVDERSDR